MSIAGQLTIHFFIAGLSKSACIIMRHGRLNFFIATSAVSTSPLLAWALSHKLNDNYRRGYNHEPIITNGVNVEHRTDTDLKWLKAR